MRKVLVLLAGACALAGCASVTRGWDEELHFSSLPAEASVRTSTGYQCITPCTLKVGRKDEMTVVFSKPGYISEEVPVRTQVAGTGAAGFAGNVALGGLVGMGVDIASGAALDHCPNPVSITLRKVGSREPRIDPLRHCAAQVTAEMAINAPERTSPQ